MNGRDGGPLSPVSLGGSSEWSGISRYQTLDTNSPYSPISRGQVATPPISSGSNGNMNGAFSRAPGGPSNGPSPPASVARSSNGGSLYNGSGRLQAEGQYEGVLSEHYNALKRFLAASLRDEKGNPRPNKARDKLLRLSYVQFQELSTDVFDELLRRQSGARRAPTAAPLPDTGFPAFLLPKDTFHPKRNQARQKLSTLPPPRFRDLATDVFYELERRFPRFVADNISRTDSPASIRAPPSRSGNGTPIDPMARPGSRGVRRPSEASSVGPYSRNESRNGQRPGPSVNSSPGGSGDFGRPQAKTFQSNTIVPNKSTMVEDDDDPADDNDDDDGDAFGLENAARSRNSKRSFGAKSSSSEIDKKLIDDYQAQVAALRERLERMEEAVERKDEELIRFKDEERDRATTVNVEKQGWSDLRRTLENQIEEAENLNGSLQTELDRVRAEHQTNEGNLRKQLEEMANSVPDPDPELARENQELREELREQQEITDEVRTEAQNFLREMRMLTERSGSSWEREEQLTRQVTKLEEEVKDWRNRYARTKTQLRGLRASSMGLATDQHVSKYLTDGSFTQPDGAVRDVNVTKFQISIDELLRVARVEDPAMVVDYMKSVIVSVRSITQDINESNEGNIEAGSHQAKLKSRVSATANNLITASKNYASAKGISPVSLLDAAASHLTAAVVELLRTVKIRPTPADELEDTDDGDTLPAINATNSLPRPENNMLPFLGMRGRESTVSSTYSPTTSPRQSSNPLPLSGTNKEPWSARRQSRGMPPANGSNGNKFAPVPQKVRGQDTEMEDLKIYLENQTEILVQTIQSLVSLIRSDAGLVPITDEMSSIAGVISSVIATTEDTFSKNAGLQAQTEAIIQRLAGCRAKLTNKAEEGKSIASTQAGDRDGEWRAWAQGLPPIAFEIARETKELVQRVEAVEESDDFS